MIKTAMMMVLTVALIGGSAQAALTGVGGGTNSLLGVGPSIISAPSDVGDDAAYNTGMQGFDEQLILVLLAQGV